MLEHTRRSTRWQASSIPSHMEPWLRPEWPTWATLYGCGHDDIQNMPLPRMILLENQIIGNWSVILPPIPTFNTFWHAAYKNETSLSGSDGWFVLGGDTNQFIDSHDPQVINWRIRSMSGDLSDTSFAWSSCKSPAYATLVEVLTSIGPRWRYTRWIVQRRAYRCCVWPGLELRVRETSWDI